MHRTTLKPPPGRSVLQALMAILAFGLSSPIADGQSTARPQGSKGALQSPANEKVFYLESWKRGSRQIKERSFHIELDKPDQEYEATLEDAEGITHYRLVIVPVRDVSTSRPVSWNVQLHEIGSPLAKHSLLSSGYGQGDTITREQNVAHLHQEDHIKMPGDVPMYLPLSTKRVIRVENFYCTIQVKSYTLQPDKEGFSSMTIDLDFSNSYTGPRYNK